MDRWNDSLFRAAAIASQLLTHEQLAEAEALAHVGVAVATEPARIDDDRLADVLVELGYLNRWQAEQLKAGRSRFVLGDYQIVDSIGQGGMGQVFKAVHTLLGRVEAIKVLPRSRATPENIASFRHEIRAQALLDHPNLVRVSYAGYDGNVYYLVTEFVPGTDLRRLVRVRGPLPMDEAAAIISQAALVLAYVHSRDLIHRDVKPGNVLVTPDGLVKLSDMGLAGFTVAGSFETGLDDPRAGKIVGTADYLAPEQILTPGELTPAVDIYALGCTLYYAVTGKVPYPGGTTTDKARRHCQDTPLHPRHFNPDLSDAFVEVIADMMEKRPADRVRDAQTVVKRLRPWTSPEGEMQASIVVPPQAVQPPSAPDQAAPGPLELDIFDFSFDAPDKSDIGSQISQATRPAATAISDTVSDIESILDPVHEAAEPIEIPLAMPLAEGAARPSRFRWWTASLAALKNVAANAGNWLWQANRRVARKLAGSARFLGRWLAQVAAKTWAAWCAVPPVLQLTLVLSLTSAGLAIGLLLYLLN